MAYFPFSIEIESRNILIVGGGKVAYRKLCRLLPFNPKIRVVAPKICREIYETEGVQICERKFEKLDVLGAFAVICATDDRDLNADIFALCQENGVLVNTVDDKEHCGFIFPSLIKKDNYTVAVTTEGRSPLCCAAIREKIEAELPESLDSAVKTLSDARELVKGRISDERNRRAAFERILSQCRSNELTNAEILSIIEEFE